MRRLILVRHAHSASNASDRVSGVPPGEGLSPLGVEQARALGAALADDPIDVGVATELRRTQETLRLALEGRGIEVEVFDGLNEIGFGAYEGGPLERYRAWAWGNEPAALCPGGGESRTDVAARVARALRVLVERPEKTILAASHALPIRYVIDGADGLVPPQRIGRIPHAEPFRLGRDAVERAIETLAAWPAAPRFRDSNG